MAQVAVSWASTVGVNGLQADDSTAQQKVGTLLPDEDGNLYRYVQIQTADATDCADGQCVYLRDAASWIVNSDQSATAGGGQVVGVGIGVITAGNYGWIMVAGIHDAVLTDGGVAAGDALIGHTVDGEADTMAAGEEHLVFGHALATDAGSPESTQARIKCL